MASDTLKSWPATRKRNVIEQVQNEIATRLLGPKSDFFISLVNPEHKPDKPNLFSKKFKPAKAQAQSMKPEPNPSPQKSGPTHL
jgi:hypothetical protein